MFENWQGIKPMKLIASQDDYKKKILHKHENVTKILESKHKKTKGYTQWDFFPLRPTILLKNKTIRRKQTTEQR